MCVTVLKVVGGLGRDVGPPCAFPCLAMKMFGSLLEVFGNLFGTRSSRDAESHLDWAHESWGDFSLDEQKEWQALVDDAMGARTAPTVATNRSLRRSQPPPIPKRRAASNDVDWDRALANARTRLKDQSKQAEAAVTTAPPRIRAESSVGDWEQALTSARKRVEEEEREWEHALAKARSKSRSRTSTIPPWRERAHAAG